MPKVEKKQLDVKDVQAKDLSLEKRTELYTKDFEEFRKEKSELYGLDISAELAGYPRALVARLVLIDLLEKDEKKPSVADKA